jgi:hypothetical protein
MYTSMSDTNFGLTLEGVDKEKPLDKSYLRSLCQKEVNRFDTYLRAVDPQFRDGLSKFERVAIEGYLYQKSKGHIDDFHKGNPSSEER